ncbi:MAG TPA: hypothetical protein ENI62_06075 [Gammaproteobacteria bacterium]|nr:hypothetical protein [Gammaproteobacteria bacterium]
MKKSMAVLVTVVSIGLGGCASLGTGTTVNAADQVLKQAATELVAVRKSGNVWLLLDKATGSKAASVGKLYAAAKAARKKGDDAAAIRLAKKVIWAAKAGQQQARNIATTAEYFTNY